jgi:hypothetical protein
LPDFILINGDTVNFEPAFENGTVTVTVRPGKMIASGPATLNGKKLCVVGDEGNVFVPLCPYITNQHTIPGMGTLLIKELAANQKAKKTKSGSKLVILKGGNFTAEFQVVVPAQQPPPGPGSPIPDATPKYTGSGSFITTNTKFQGS